MSTILPCPLPEYFQVSIPSLSQLTPGDPLLRHTPSSRQRALEASENTTDGCYLLRRAKHNLGLGDLVEARAGAIQAAEAALAAGRIGVAVNAWATLASIEMRFGNQDAAFSTAEQIAVFAKNSQQARIWALDAEARGNIALEAAMFMDGDAVEAREAYTVAQKFYHDLGDRLGEIRCLVGLANSWTVIGKYGCSLESSDQALFLCKYTGDWRYCHRILTSAASVLCDQGYRQGVEDLFKLAIEWSEFIGDRTTRIVALRGLGCLYAYEMPWGAASEVPRFSIPLATAIREAEAIGAKPLELAARCSLAFLRQKGGDAEAWEDAESYVTRWSVAIGARERYALHFDRETSARHRRERMSTRLHEGIELSADALFLFDALRGSDGKLLDLVNEFRNPAAARLLGIDITAVRMLHEVSGLALFAGLETRIKEAVLDHQSYEDLISFGDPNEPSGWLVRHVSPSKEGAVLTFRDVTERQRLIASKARMEEAAQAGGVGIWQLDFRTDVFVWDERMLSLYGRLSTGFGGSLDEWLSYLHPEDVAPVLARWHAAIEGKAAFEADFRAILPDGSIRYVRALAHVIRDEAGIPERAVGTNWDITDHKLLTARLYEEKERFRITLQSVEDAVISADGEGAITYLNPAAERMTGWTFAEAVGESLSNVLKIVDEATEQVLPNCAQMCLQRGETFRRPGAAALVDWAGVRRLVQDSAAPVISASGQIVGVVTTLRDVTLERSAQKELERSATRDDLTGLANRSAFERRLQYACEDAGVRDAQHALCFIDLDRFKGVNDGAGHAAGDIVLREVSVLMSRVCRTQDFAARIGGDEFALLLFDCSVRQARSIAQRLAERVSEVEFEWNDRAYRVGTSIGIAAISQESNDPTETKRQADIACYAAKAAGRGLSVVYGDPAQV